MGTPVVRGVVRLWHRDEGWGVVDPAETPGGCWVHFSRVASTGYRELAPGQTVTVEWEAGDQDGLAFRATRVRPDDDVPDVPGEPAPTTSGERTAFASTLTLRFDPPDSR